MYTVRVKCAPVPRQRVHPILQWRKPGHNPGVCYEYHTEFAHSRKPAYARPPFCGGSNPSQSAIAMGAYRFISLGIIKCPAGGGHFIIPGGDEVFPRTMHTHRLRGNRDGSTALCLSRLLVFEPLGSHDTYVRHKFTRHKGRVNLWRCKKSFTFGL